MIDYFPWYIRIFFWFQRRKYGEVLNSSQVWARSPRTFLALSTLFGTLDRKNSPIPAHHRSLIIVRVSQLNGCDFCIDLNTSILLQRGVSIDKTQQIQDWSNSPLFNDSERLILGYTEAVTLSKGPINKDLQEQMTKHYSPKELVEITAIIVFQNMSTKFNNAYGIEPQGFCYTKEASK